MRCEAPDGGVDVDALMQVSAAMTSVGVNVPRVVNQHPDLVRDAVGEELTMPERLVDRIDREIDESS
ncbi:hypothetical protein [Halobaculum sp. P14]|uniref:hypothetical protein n=1 Tax=Halobaculum sp. P14 TaxID=3421638 RepID=UPI003EBEC985